MRPATPLAPGTDAAGIVAAVGPQVTRFRPGDRVTGGRWTGAYAERIVVDEWEAARVPDGLSLEVASTIRHAYGTAWYGLVERAKLQSGETVLVTGAAGGVGLAAVDLARHLNARVIAAVGSPEKAALVREYGAAEVVNYRDEDLKARIKELTVGVGVDVCFELVGGEVFAQMARLMAWEGRLMPIGFVGGEVPSVPMNLPLLKNYSIVGVSVGAANVKQPRKSARMFDTLAELAAAGAIRPHVQAIMPLEHAGEALRAVGDRRVHGRIVLAVR